MSAIYEYLDDSFVGQYFKAGCGVIVITMTTSTLPQQKDPQISVFVNYPVTYPFYCIFRKLPKFFNFSGGMAKSYSVDLKLYRKSHYYFFELQKIPLNNFQKLLFELAHLVLHACKKSGWGTKQNFEIKTNVLCKFYFQFAQFYLVFNFW